jgi:hypothetical protein
VESNLEEIWVTAIIALLIGGVWHLFGTKLGEALVKVIMRFRGKSAARSDDYHPSRNEPINPE